MGFDEEKKNALGKLNTALAAEKVDGGMLPLIEIINSKPNLFTSSSCYGRIVIFDSPNKSKEDTAFVAKWHRQVGFDEVRKTLDSAAGGDLWFRMEGFILHISCRDIETAGRVLELKTKLGLKRGGIFHVSDDRVQIELVSTLKMDLPVKHNGTMLVSDEYLKTIINEANVKMQRNSEDVEKLKSELGKL